MSDQSATTAKIAALNDQCRRELATFGQGAIPGRCVVTSGIAEQGPAFQLDITTRVIAYDDFSEDSDPYGEHEFGVIDHPTAGKVFWKIDYYADSSCQWGSEYPEDPQRSFRVLTIMLAHEY